jgi:hypothetical protein
MDIGDVSSSYSMLVVDEVDVRLICDVCVTLSLNVMVVQYLSRFSGEGLLAVVRMLL